MLAASDPEALPIEPGAGPFRIKGVAYLGHLEYVQRFVVGGVDGMVAELRDRRQAEFFRQKFLSASFYDIFPLVAAGFACARQARLSFAQFVRMRSRFQAERDVEGVHRVLLKLVSPAMVITRLPMLQAQYLDFPGDATAAIVEPNHAVLERRTLPELLARWFTIVNDAYIDVVMTAAGARQVVVRANTVQRDALSHGWSTVKYHCDVLWT